MGLSGIEGFRDMLNTYRLNTAREPRLIRVSPNCSPDTVYVGEFGGRPPEVVLGTYAWKVLTADFGPDAEVTVYCGLDVVVDE